MSDHDEWVAAQTADATCYQHSWAANRQGGGTCTVCGETVDGEEL